MTETIRAIRLERTGGPDVLEKTRVALPPPAAGMVQLRHEAIGVNYIDIYHRTGLYPLPLPTGLGLEAAGTVVAVGEGVTDFAPGDRVGYFTGPIGAYAEAANVPADRLVHLPPEMAFEEAAALLLKGATVEYLISRAARIAPGMWVLFHAGAGGVGHLALPWLKAIGAHVVTTVGSSKKAEVAQALGADHVILYREEPVAERVRAITNGRGVDVVFDGVGAATWSESLASLRRRGLLVSFGNASGPVPPISLLDLTAAGSVFVTRPSLMDYYTNRTELAEGSARVFSMWQKGVLRVRIAARFPLRAAAEAHRFLEERRSIGSVILIP